jgi:hypothetical protein
MLGGFVSDFMSGFWWSLIVVHGEYAILIAFPKQQWFPNAPHCYVTRTLPVLLFFAKVILFMVLADTAIDTRRRLKHSRMLRHF